MRNRIILLVLAGCLLAAPVHAEVDSPLVQSTGGDKSPVIRAGRDAVVNYGLKKEEYRQMLREELRRAAEEMRTPGLTADERRLLEQKIKALEEKSANLRKSYEEELARRQSADKALAEMKGQLSDARIAAARESLKNGDTKAAEQVFDEVVDKEGGAVALAAYQSGQLAEGRVDYAKAMRQYRKAAVLEENNPDYLLAAGKMALTVADYDRAREWLERLLKIREAEKKDDAELALVLDRLATLYQYQGYYKEAEPLFQRSLAISEQSLGKDHPSVATTLNNLAGLYRAQGRYPEAEPLYQRSLAILEQSLGKDHPSVATTLNNLAGLYASQVRYAEAEPLYQRALAIWEQSLGKEHPHVASALDNLAGLYASQVRYAEAEPLYQRALAIREQSLGRDHPDVATTLNNLAGLYRAQGRYAEAEPLYQRCLSILKAAFPNGHPNIDAGQANYDGLQRKMAEQ